MVSDWFVVACRSFFSRGANLTVLLLYNNNAPAIQGSRQEHCFCGWENCRNDRPPGTFLCRREQLCDRMKVETPQILWNAEGDKGKNAPLYSVDMLESGIASDSSPQEYSHVLVTAGNSNIINLWKVCFGGNNSNPGGSSSTSTSPNWKAKKDQATNGNLGGWRHGRQTKTIL
jgi:hypothetical protein